jgi:hypothetical protein
MTGSSAPRDTTPSRAASSGPPSTGPAPAVEGALLDPTPRQRPKVVHVSIVHRATDIRIFHKQCRTLAAAGYDVILYARTEEASATAGVRIRPVPAPRSRLVRMTSGVWSLLRPLLAETSITSTTPS